MNALTLRPPWGYAIARLGKRIENRDWPPPAAARGKLLAIHAGKMPALGRDGAQWQEIRDALDWMEGRGIALPEALLVGHLARYGSAVVAVATLAGVVTESSDPWFVGRFGWQLADVLALPEPVACRGAQKLWTLPVDVEARVLEQLAAGRAGAAP